MKTYSVAIQNDKGHWLTNYHEYASKDDIKWDSVKLFCENRNYKAYGFYYGHNSRNLTSSKNRTVLEVLG